MESSFYDQIHFSSVRKKIGYSEFGLDISMTHFNGPAENKTKVTLYLFLLSLSFFLFLCYFFSLNEVLEINNSKLWQKWFDE